MLTQGHNLRGFTLLELVLVLAVLAIALMAVAPNLSGLGRARAADDAAARFVSLARLARSQAVTDGAAYRIVIDASGGKWWLELEDADDDTVAPAQFGEVVSMPEDVKIETDAPATGGVTAIVFDPSGRVDVATVRFVGPNKTVTVTCESPLDEFHIVTEASR